MNIKKSVVLVVMLLLGFMCFEEIISAEETDQLIWGGQLEEAPEYEEIQEDISNNEFFTYVSECFKAENVRITPEEMNDISLTPYKLYQPNTAGSIDYFNAGTKERQKYIEILKQCNYSWQFLFKKDNVYVGVAVLQHRPLAQDVIERLTPEEIKKAEQEIGTWYIGGSFYSRENESLREIAEKLIAEKEDIKDYIILNGSYVGFGKIALGFDDREIKYIIPLYDTSDETYLPIGFKNIVPKDKAIILNSGHLIYKYADAAPYGSMILEYSLQYIKEHGVRTGGVPGIHELEEKLKVERQQKEERSKGTAVIAILAMVVGTTLIIYRLKKRKQQV